MNNYTNPFNASSNLVYIISADHWAKVCERRLVTYAANALFPHPKIEPSYGIDDDLFYQEGYVVKIDFSNNWA